VFGVKPAVNLIAMWARNLGAKWASPVPPKAIAHAASSLLTCRRDGRGGEAGLARGWAISGVGDRTREAVVVAADAAGMPVGAWVDKALTKALAEGLEAGVSVEATGQARAA
jgi:hypothetical protein